MPDKLELSLKAKQSGPIPVTIVAGFLGAGKTTLLNHILTGGHGRRVGVIVNDFGSINVDAELINEVKDGMISLANGCICCGIRTDLIKAVLDLADRPDHPEHIVIESSGVADPEGVFETFLLSEIRDKVLIDGVLTVVDAEQILSIPEQEAKLAKEQIIGADLIILNKIDLVDAETLSKVRQWIEKQKPNIPILAAENCQLPIEVLLGVNAPEDTPRGTKQTASEHSHGPHDHHHSLEFETWNYVSDQPMHLALVQQLLNHLPATLFRAKGFLFTTDKPDYRLVLQLVGRRAVMSVDQPWGNDAQQTRLVFIARHGTCDFEAIGKALTQCQSEKAVS